MSKKVGRKPYGSTPGEVDIIHRMRRYRNLHHGRRKSYCEIAGVFVLVLGVAGVVLNNRLDRRCFHLWMVSKTISIILHAQAHIGGAEGMAGLMLRNAMFFALSIEGLLR